MTKRSSYGAVTPTAVLVSIARTPMDQFQGELGSLIASELSAVAVFGGSVTAAGNLGRTRHYSALHTHDKALEVS